MSDRVSADTRSLVAERASNICDYCLLAEEDSYYHHQIEHIISRKHGGSSDSENLALLASIAIETKAAMSDRSSVLISSFDFTTLEPTIGAGTLD